MLRSATAQKLIPILKKECRQVLKVKVPGFPQAYYCSYLLRDTHWFNTWARSGSTYRKRSDHARNLYADIRVGAYEYDQVTDGGLYDNDKELESYSHIDLPIDDKNYDGLRIAIWRLTEAKFREALADYNQRQSNSLSTVDQNRSLASFHKLPTKTSIKPARFDHIDQDKWELFCKQASAWLSRLPKVLSNSVDFDSNATTKVFVSSEDRVIVEHQQIFSLSATISHLTAEGAEINQELILNVGRLWELPDLPTFKRMMLRKHKQLLQLIKARKVHAFSGPVLLYPKPAGLLFHEAVGHRLEGSRLLSSGEGQTFRDQIGKEILGVKVDISDDPTCKRHKDTQCIGAYDYDDEGTKSRPARLIVDGKLQGFLSTRAELPSGLSLNGHARAKKYQRPISRMGVTVIRGKTPLTIKELKQKLIEEINQQKKPFGLIIYETAGGETDTSSFDFQGFSGEISFAKLVYPDGKEEVIRGVDFVGTPLQALASIIAVGSDADIDNHFCGAESGFIPVTTISPAILLESLELQSKSEELVTQYLLEPPKLD
jgi:TldD protein